MTTLKDLSRHLGLSVTQVSRALNDHDDVSTDTKRRVREAAKALDYQPNIMARRLVTGRSGIVGLVWGGVPQPSESWFFTQFVGGLSSHFSELGLQFMLHIASDGHDEIGVYDNLTRSRSIDGFVVVLPLEADARVDFLRERGIPFVLHGQTMDVPDYPFYDINNHAVGYELTAHLAKNGHREIAIINGQAGASFVQRRYAGYAQAMREAGLPLRPEYQVGGIMTAEFGMLETVRMFQSGGPRPTGIVAGNTRIAKGIFDALKALGLRAPDDVSVVVHDDRLPDVPIESLPIQMTATVAPLEEAWGALARFLDLALKGAPVHTTQQIGPHVFVQRHSVRRL